MPIECRKVVETEQVFKRILPTAKLTLVALDAFHLRLDAIPFPNQIFIVSLKRLQLRSVIPAQDIARLVVNIVAVIFLVTALIVFDLSGLSDRSPFVAELIKRFSAGIIEIPADFSAQPIRE